MSMSVVDMSVLCGLCVPLWNCRLFSRLLICLWSLVVPVAKNIITIIVNVCTHMQ